MTPRGFRCPYMGEDHIDSISGSSEASLFHGSGKYFSRPQVITGCRRSTTFSIFWCLTHCYRPQECHRDLGFAVEYSRYQDDQVGPTTARDHRETRVLSHPASHRTTPAPGLYVRAAPPRRRAAWRLHGVGTGHHPQAFWDGPRAPT